MKIVLFLALTSLSWGQEPPRSSKISPLEPSSETSQEDDTLPIGSDKAEEPTAVTDAISISRYEAVISRRQEFLAENENILDPYSSRESWSEYTIRIHNEPEFDPTSAVFPSTVSHSSILGDVTHNDSNDGEVLTLVAPAEEGSNPLKRPQEFPETPIIGNQHYDGIAQFVLVTSFIENKTGSGKVWAIPATKPDDSYELVSGLQSPTSVCFDINNDFLYVVDSPKILQFEVNRLNNIRLVLRRSIYVEIYEGTDPQDCKIDQAGNLFIVEGSNDLLKIDYTSLYKGYKNMHYTLYTRGIGVPLDSPVALDIVDSKTLYVVNHSRIGIMGLLFEGTAQATTINGEHFSTLWKSDFPGEGLTYADGGRLFFSQSNANVWVLDLDEREPVIKSVEYFLQPKKLCADKDNIFVADYGKGGVFILSNSAEENETPDVLVHLQAAYGLCCVNVK